MTKHAYHCKAQKYTLPKTGVWEFSVIAASIRLSQHHSASHAHAERSSETYPTHTSSTRKAVKGVYWMQSFHTVPKDCPVSGRKHPFRPLCDCGCSFRTSRWRVPSSAALPCIQLLDVTKKIFCSSWIQPKTALCALVCAGSGQAEAQARHASPPTRLKPIEKL